MTGVADKSAPAVAASPSSQQAVSPLRASIRNARHTPGPWAADFHNEQREGGRFITYVRGGNQLVPIAAIPSGVEGYGRDEGRANAALIAAAPDLLAALEAVLDSSGARETYHALRYADAVEAAEAAIAKAKGENQ